ARPPYTCSCTASGPRDGAYALRRCAIGGAESIEAVSSESSTSLVTGPSRRKSSDLPGLQQLRRRDQHAELLAPDHDVRIPGEIDTVRQVVVLAALEGAQPSEVDEHRLRDIRIRRHVLLGN